MTLQADTPSLNSESRRRQEMVWSEFVNRDYDRLNANTGTRSTFIPYNTGIDLPEPVLVPKKR